MVNCFSGKTVLGKGKGTGRMKVSIFENPAVTEDHAEIHCQSATDEILWAGAETPLSISGIFYFEAVEKRTFACLQTEVYEVFLTLKEAEERFRSLGFVRISKSVVVNLYRVQAIKNDFEMRTLICLDNQENLIISRHYRSAFRERLAAAVSGKEARS